MSRNNPETSTPKSYRNIVIPTDGSDGARYAAEHGLTIAEKFGATVHAVSVIEEGGSVQRDQLRTSPEELAQEAVEQIEAEAKRRATDVQTETLTGTPEESIIIYIEEQDADMVVMSTHGRTGIEQVVFGSVTEEIVRNSPVPVLTVHPPQWED